MLLLPLLLFSFHDILLYETKKKGFTVTSSTAINWRSAFNVILGREITFDLSNVM
jgi:hypothetical protein